MVSERGGRSYAAAVVMEADGEGNRADRAGTSSNQTSASQNQRNDDFDDPLYLHITENPNIALVSPPLSEINYASWSRSMKIALEVKNKFGFVNGAISCPEEFDPKIASWRRCNRIVASWILKSLTPDIADGVMYFDKASDIWNTLHKRYSQSDPHRISEIQNQISRNVQGSLTVNEYFTKCNALWQQMNALRPLLQCECVPKCSCTLMRRMQKEREEDHIIRFLEGLNEEYETIKSGVLVMDPIPDMEKVLNMTLKVERKIRGSLNQKSGDIIQSNAVQSNQQSGEEQSIVAAATSNYKKKFTNGGGRNVPKCTFCGMLGHTIEKCYKKHGYPPGWVAGYKTKSKQSQDIQQGLSASVSQANEIGLSVEQFHKLMSLVQNQNKGNQASSSAVMTVANSGLKPDFKNTMENHNEGGSWDNGWFC